MDIAVPQGRSTEIETDSGCGTAKKGGRRAMAIKVAVLQLWLSILAAAPAAGIAGPVAAQAAILGGGCALAGTVAYAGVQRGIPGNSPARLMWGHVAGETAKVLVTLGLLGMLLAGQPGQAAASLAGFGAALLAYPAAIFLLNK